MLTDSTQQLKAVSKRIGSSAIEKARPYFEALEAASLHPAAAVGLDGVKGSLDFGSDADFIMIDQDEMQLLSTWIAGSCVYKSG